MLYDASAIGSDVPRSFSQFLARKVAAVLVAALRLNRGGFWSTELVQQIQPLCTIPTKGGPLYSRGGHGRLRWRAATFYTEEPETIRWLESMGPDDTLWDIGANVGLYSLYAAKVSGAKVLAIEPEAQNHALLIENIALNALQGRVEAMNVACAACLGIGRLEGPALTKGGAYNRFTAEPGPALRPDAGEHPTRVTQWLMGISLDELAERFGLGYPTHVKIDVDGNEPEIVSGGTTVLRHSGCKSVLIEVQTNEPKHKGLADTLLGMGYRCVSERSNWESRRDRARESEWPTINMIFARP